MKIILENNDKISFKQVYKIASKQMWGDREITIYETECRCSIIDGNAYNAGNIAMNCGDEKVKDMTAEVLFAEICNTQKYGVAHDIVDYIAKLSGFEMYKEEEQGSVINIKSGKDGIMLEINNQTFTPEQLKKSAINFKSGQGNDLDSNLINSEPNF